MTAIAYRAGVMAADGVASCGGVQRPCSPKITRKPDGTLIGISAYEATGRHFVEEWPTIDRAKWPTMAEGDLRALIVKPDGAVWECDWWLMPFELPNEFWAIGSAAPFLFGAMAAGASAEQAVRLAIEHADGIGGPIQIERMAAP